MNGQVIRPLHFHKLGQLHVMYTQRDKSIMRDEMIAAIMDVQHQLGVRGTGFYMWSRYRSNAAHKIVNFSLE